MRDIDSALRYLLALRLVLAVRLRIGEQHAEHSTRQARAWQPERHDVGHVIAQTKKS